MKKALCIIQDGMFSDQQIKSIQGGFNRIYQETYRPEKLNVLWMIAPKGYAYSERKPSNAMIVMIEVEERISRLKREELLEKISSFLLNNFKVSPLDSVITAPDSSYVNAFLASQNKRIHPKSRLWISTKQLFKALTSKLIKGYTLLLVQH